MKRIPPYFHLLLLLSGCFYIGQDRYEDVLRHPASEWSSRDCLTVILSVMGNNFNDQSTCIRVMATPYYPAVIAAANRIGQQRMHGSDEAFQHDMDTLLKAEVGLFMDWEKGALVDSKGNYYRDPTQLDSLMFLVTIQNVSTCNVPNLVMGSGKNLRYMPIASISDWPCYLPDISDLESRIMLRNGRNETLRPLYVWGRRHNILTTDETLLVMFNLRKDSTQFLSRGDEFALVVKGFERDIRLKFPIAMIR